MKTRIATVKATGKKYVVLRLYLPTQASEKAKCFCCGELVSFMEDTLNARHEKTKVFLLDAVEIEEVPRTRELVEELFTQTLKAYPTRYARTRRVRRKRR